MTRGFAGFPPETLPFLRNLSTHNNRDWFQANKEIYEQKVKEPMTELVLALGYAMQGFAPEMVVDPRRTMFRIYRDTRFSKDKSPYKTHIAAVFWPQRLQRHQGAALYFHISPEEVLIAGGIYMPMPPDLRAIRQYIAGHAPELRKIITGKTFKNEFGEMTGEQTKRSPREFAADHPAGDLLRYKQFLVSITEPPEFAESPRLFSRIVKAFIAVMPLIRYLNTPLGVTLRMG